MSRALSWVLQKCDAGVPTFYGLRREVIPMTGSPCDTTCITDYSYVALCGDVMTLLHKAYSHSNASRH